MPQVTVYIRKDDLDKWKSLKKKSEWLSNQLNEEQYPLMKIKSSMPKTLQEANNPKSSGYSAKVSPGIIKTPQQAKQTIGNNPGYLSKAYSARKKGSKLKYDEDL